MKVAFFASDPIAIESIEALRKSSEWELACVVSNPDKPKGRGKKLAPNEVSEWALKNGVELIRPEKSPTPADMETLRRLGVEMIIVMAYGHILKNWVLEYSRYPCINLHASLLPDLRGPSPIETAVALGYSRTGVSLMRISPAMDEGDVCANEVVEISYSDTSLDVRAKVASAAARVLVENLGAVVDASAKFQKQDSSRATYTRKLTPADLLLDFRKSADELRNRIRAFGCGVFEYCGARYKVGSSRVIDGEIQNARCGKILEASACGGFKIACARGTLEILQIQKPCAKMMCVRDFFLGANFCESEVLESFDNENLIRGI